MDSPVRTSSDMNAHVSTYEGFVRGFAAGSYHIFFTLVALVGFGFVRLPLNLFLGFGGLVVGSACAIYGFRFGKYKLPVVVLIIYAILVAVSVTG